jgi:hypothetical protein
METHTFTSILCYYTSSESDFAADSASLLSEDDAMNDEEEYVNDDQLMP